MSCPSVSTDSSFRNAQLTITLLRIGEANKAPLPPPPHSKEPPPDEPVEISEEHLRATGAGKL